MTDMINHPPHYITDAGIEAIDVIEQYGLGYHLGNAMKYLLRAGRKGDATEDLKKAAWYLARARTRRPGALLAGMQVAVEQRHQVNAIIVAFNLSAERAVAVSAILLTALRGDTDKLPDAIDGAAEAVALALRERAA